MFKLCLAFALLASSFSTLAKVVFVSDSGFIVKNEIQVNHTSEQTWNNFIHNVGVWWPSDHTWWGDAKALTIDSFAGGCFCEKSGTKSAEHMRVSFVEPYKLLRMTGGLGPLQGMGMHGALNWEFEPTKHGTKVIMTYKVSGINPEGFTKLAPIVDRVQALQLNGLKNYMSSSN